ncbi:MAG: DUF3800 domain-containing protein [Lachnospiraceae bacterium]|nr:DUF3800 domain-containing protein [Lachnospiraceae bacterium]
MKKMSVFVDESGDFGNYAKHSPFYVLTMVFHDQSKDISGPIKRLEDNLKNLGYDNYTIHTEPLVRREDIYENLEPNERRGIFIKLFYFLIHADVSYKTFIYEKIHYTNSDALRSKMVADISSFLRENLSYFQAYDQVVVYYDNGQREITKIIKAAFLAELNNYEIRKVRPAEYRLFQAADLVCTLTLLQKRYELNALTRSDMLLFYSKKDLRKDFLKRIKEKEFGYVGG